MRTGTLKISADLSKVDFIHIGLSSFSSFDTTSKFMEIN